MAILLLACSVPHSTQAAPSVGTTAFNSPTSGGFTNIGSQTSPRSQNYLGYKFTAVSTNLVSITHASGRVNLVTGASSPASDPIYFAIGSDDGSQFKAMSWNLRSTNALWTGNITATGYRDGAAVSGATSIFNIAAAVTDYTWDVSADTDFNNVDEIRFTGPTAGTGALSFNSITVNPAVVAASAPTVTTPTSASITASTAILGGNVTADGGGTITERGVVYAVTTTNNNPQLNGSGVVKITASGTTGVFTANATGLTPGTGYSFAAYATNSTGTTYTTPVSTFATLSDNANLSGLVLSSGPLSPAFASLTTAYTADVLRPVTAVTLTATVAEPHATLAMRVNGGGFASATSGSAGPSLALNVGDNMLDVRVTAEDGVTQKTYSVALRRLTYLEAWRRTHFGTIADSGIAANTVDPQHDALANLLKFALAMDPGVTGVSPVVFVKNGSVLEFSYPRSIEATVECTFIVEWSDTLVGNDWSTVGVTEQIISATSAVQQVKASLPDGGGLRRFVRLRVTTP